MIFLDKLYLQGLARHKFTKWLKVEMSPFNFDIDLSLPAQAITERKVLPG